MNIVPKIRVRYMIIEDENTTKSYTIKKYVIELIKFCSELYP